MIRRIDRKNLFYVGDLLMTITHSIMDIFAYIKFAIRIQQI